jgi:hypothetical protein
VCWKGNLVQIPGNLKVLAMNGFESINSLFQTILESDSISFGASLLGNPISNLYLTMSNRYIISVL